MEEIALTYPRLNGNAFREIPPIPPIVHPISHSDSETEEEENEEDNDFGVLPN